MVFIYQMFSFYFPPNSSVICMLTIILTSSFCCTTKVLSANEILLIWNVFLSPEGYLHSFSLVFCGSQVKWKIPTILERFMKIFILILFLNVQCFIKNSLCQVGILISVAMGGPWSSGF